MDGWMDGWRKMSYYLGHVFLSSVRCPCVFLCVHSKSVCCRRRSCWILHSTTALEGLLSVLRLNGCLTRKELFLQ